MINKQYQVDYDSMRSELSKLQIFHDKNLQQLYIDKWIEVLEEADSVSVKSFFAPQNAFLLVKERQEAPELFQTIVKMKSNDLLIHFRISRIIQAMQMVGISESNAEELNVEDFISKQQFNWTQTDATNKRDDPILIVPFTLGKTYKYLVIDGNHRIATAIRNKQDKIKAIFLAPEFLVNGNLFVSLFDKMLYIFQNEIVWIGSFYNKNINDERYLITNSFLSNGQINVS